MFIPERNRKVYSNGRLLYRKWVEDGNISFLKWLKSNFLSLNKDYIDAKAHIKHLERQIKYLEDANNNLANSVRNLNITNIVGGR